MTTALQFSEIEIDRLTAEGFSIYSFTDRRERPSDYTWPNSVGEWNIRLVNTRGLADEGELIATPTGGRTRKIYMDGKIRAISADLTSVELDTIKRYVELSKRQKYALETPVYRWVLSHYAAMTATRFWEIYNAKNSFEVARSYGCTAKMTWPRFQAAMFMMAKMLKIEDELPQVN